jgi:uncharacterized membrane protein (UPF0127 family)
MQLIQTSTKKVLIPNLEVADSVWTRMKGLLGRESLEDDQALWITKCSSVHTFFMKFPIDLIFVDRQLVVKRVFKNVKPARIVWAVFSADSVLELKAGFLEKNPLVEGEQLHVDR